LSDRPTDHRARQIWQPRSANRPTPEADSRAGAAAPPEAGSPGGNAAQRSADVRVLAPTQDADTAALSADLVAIAERALADRFQAEQLVAGLCREQAGLVTTATRSAMPSQRDAARTELERLVRRAALDSLPPVIGNPSADRGRPAGAAGSRSESRKVAAPAVGRAKSGAAAPPPAPPLAPEPVPSAPEPRPAGRPAGRTDLSSTADLPGADRPRGPITAPRGTASAVKAPAPRRGRKLALSALAAAALLGGLGFGYFAYAPETPLDPEFAGTPTPMPEPESEPEPEPTPTSIVEAPPVAEAPQTSELSAESLQLEAAEPAAGPLLRQGAELGEPASPPGAPAQPPVTLPDGLRLILIHQNNSAAAASADALQARLAALKDPLQAEVRSVDFSIATPRIRYFYADDASSAATLADILGPPANGTGSWEVQDFTHLRPGPTQGTVEVFVPDTGS